MYPLLRYLLSFLVLNLILNVVYRISPLLGMLIFIGFIVYSFRRSFAGVRFSTPRYQTPPQQPNYQSFRRDPNVIDAEYQEHKTN